MSRSITRCAFTSDRAWRAVRDGEDLDRLLVIDLDHYDLRTWRGFLAYQWGKLARTNAPYAVAYDKP